jgi:hypothetical protein
VPLIEDDVAANLHPLHHRVEDLVCLGSLCVADEDTGLATVIQLVELAQVLGVGDAAKSL